MKALGFEDYVRPYAVNPRSVGDPWTTLFVFVFDASNIDPETARRDIGTCLRNLNARTLLFLRKIKEIEYKLSDTEGIYLRNEVTQGSARKVEVLGQNNGQDENESWLIFGRPVKVPDKSGQIAVEVAFRLETSTKDRKERIARENNSRLVVYFPTEKRHKIGLSDTGSIPHDACA